MRKTIWFILALVGLAVLFAVAARGATVTFTMTNSLGQPDTNRIRLQPLASYANADGSWQTTSPPFWIYPNTNGIVSTNLGYGNWIATNGFICSQFVGPGQVGTSQGIIFAVPNSSGSFTFGQLAISGYNVYNYNGASFTVSASNIFSAIGYTPLTPQQVTNLFLLSNTNQYFVGTNIVANTNGGNITYQVPNQTFLTNGLVTSAVTNGLATTNFAILMTNGFTGIVFSNPAAYATPVLATNIAFAQATNQGAMNTNFTSGATNTVYLNVAANLTSASNSLQSSIVASNSSQSSALLAATNSLWVQKQPSSGILTNLAGTGAWTNTAIYAGTNITASTNPITFAVTLNVPTQTGQTSGLVQWTGLQPSSFVSQSQLPSLTNQFVTQNAITGFLSQATAAQTYYPTSNPSGFVQSSITNGFLSTNTAYALYYPTSNPSGFILAVQATNAANGVYSNNPASYLTAVATNRFITGLLASNSFDAIGAAPSNAFNSLVTATNSFDKLGAANSVYSNNPSGYMVGRNATNSFDPTNAALNVYTANPLHYMTLIGTASLISTNNNNVVAFMINASNTVFSKLYDPTNAAAMAYTNAVITASNLPFVRKSGDLIANFFGFGTKTNFLVTTNLIDIYGVPGLQVVGVYQGLPFGNVWTNLNNTAETIQYAAPNFFLFTNYGSILLYQSANAVNWQVAGTGVAPAPLGAYGTKWRIGGTIDGYLNSTDLTAQIARYVATNSGGGIIGTNASTNFLMGGVLTNFTTNTLFSTLGTNAIVAMINTFGTSPTNGLTAAQVTNVVTGMTNGLATLVFVTNYVGSVTSTVTSQYQVYIANLLSTLGTLGVTNLNILGVGPNGGAISFPHGDSIFEMSPSTPQVSTDSGLSVGLKNGQVFGESYTFVAGASNDVAGSLANHVNGANIAGGVNNTIGNDTGSGNFSTIGGGNNNYIADANQSVIIGGSSNTIGALGWVWHSVIAGGYSNSILANPLGMNIYGVFVAGEQAQATNGNSFVWNDGANGLFTTATSNTFIIHSTNGVGINTNNPTGYSLNVHGGVNSDTGFSINGVPVSGGGGGNATNAIGMLNGFGTNTTLLGVNSINGILFYNSPSTNVANAPIMSSDSTPSGTVTSSSQNDSVNHPDWAAIGYPSSGDWISGLEFDQWIQYQFPSPITADCFQVQINGGTVNQPFALQVSPDGTNWNNAYYSGNQTWVTGGIVTNYFPITTSAFWRWNFYNSSASVADISNLQLYNVALSVVDAGTNFPIQIKTPLAINTTAVTNGSQLEVNGNADVNALSIQGIPIQSLIMQYIQSISIAGVPANPTNSYTLTGGISNSAPFNGNYSQWIAPPFNQSGYLNSSGEKISLVGSWTASPFPSGIPANVFSVFNFNRGQFYTNSVTNAILGTYSAFGATTPTNALTVANLAQITVLQSSSSSPFNGSLITNISPTSVNSDVLTNNRTADTTLRGLLVKAGLSVYPTNKNDGFNIQPQLPGYTGKPLYVLNTNGTKQFLIDSNLQVNGDGFGITNLAPSAIAAAGGVTNGGTLWQFMSPNGTDAGLQLSNLLTTCSNVYLMPGTYNATNCVTPPPGSKIIGSGPDSTIWLHWNTNSPYGGNGVGGSSISSLAFFFTSNLYFANFTISNAVNGFGAAIGSYATNNMAHPGLVYSFTTRNMRIYEQLDGFYWKNETNVTWSDYGSEFYLLFDGIIPNNYSYITNYGTIYHNAATGASLCRTLWVRNGANFYLNGVTIDEQTGNAANNNWAIGFDSGITPATVTAVNTTVTSGLIGDITGLGGNLNWYGPFSETNLPNVLGNISGGGTMGINLNASMIPSKVYVQGQLTLVDTDLGTNNPTQNTSTYTNIIGVNIANIGGHFIGNGSGLTNLTSLAWTNSGAGYLTTGGFKTAAAAGIVYVTCCVTNSQIVWLTNQTTHDVVIMGNTTGTWTNFDNASLPVNSGDSIAITNVSGGNGLLVTSRFYSIH